MSTSEKHKTPPSSEDFRTDGSPTVTLDPSTTAQIPADLDVAEGWLPMGFGRFELRAVIGRGGFGTVFRA